LTGARRTMFTMKTLPGWRHDPRMHLSGCPIYGVHFCYEVRATASINHDVQSQKPAYLLDEDAPIYQFDTNLEIFGTSIAPSSRAGEMYHLSLFGDGSSSGSVNRTLKSMQERDEHDAPKYRTYRGQTVPVYRVPRGLAMMNKQRGEPRWTVWIPALPRFVSDVLLLLGQNRQLYITLYERRFARQRWLQYLSIQTDDPREDI